MLVTGWADRPPATPPPPPVTVVAGVEVDTTGADVVAAVESPADESGEAEQDLVTDQMAALLDSSGALVHVVAFPARTASRRLRRLAGDVALLAVAEAAPEASAVTQSRLTAALLQVLRHDRSDTPTQVGRFTRFHSLFFYQTFSKYIYSSYYQVLLEQDSNFMRGLLSSVVYTVRSKSWPGVLFHIVVLLLGIVACEVYGVYLWASWPSFFIQLFYNCLKLNEMRNTKTLYKSRTANGKTFRNSWNLLRGSSFVGRNMKPNQ